ncbi:unnamed protein product [Echinostoma caproni]|uniref:Reverse transcriptase domain-containing protein n=1 Tax=Echinostoma caproni TaxID=27848 RepID=A0A183B2A0_9TREM|nr:unnamed protein product [Echinostoma caproni]
MTRRESNRAPPKELPKVPPVLLNPHVVVIVDLLEDGMDSQIGSDKTDSEQPMLSQKPTYLSKLPDLEETEVAAVFSGVMPVEEIRVNEKRYLEEKEALVLLHANACSIRKKRAELATAAEGTIVDPIVRSEI